MIADLTLSCSSCRDEFTFSIEEQEFYKVQGYTTAPRRCKACRRSRRAGGSPSASARPARQRQYSATCAACGAPTTVPFKPDPARPSFCRSCYSRRRAR